MGQNQSELTNSISKITSLEKKPDLLKQELRSFVNAVSLETPLPVKVDKKVAPIMLNLLKTELDAKNREDTLMILQSFQRLLKTRGFYTSLPSNKIQPIIETIHPKQDEALILAGLDTIAWCLACRVTPEPSQENKFRRSEAEEQMKIAFFETRGYDSLIALFTKHCKNLESTNAIIPKILDILSMDLVDRAHTSRFVILQRILSQLSPHIDVILDMTLAKPLLIRGFSSILLQGYLMHAPYLPVSEKDKLVPDNVKSTTPSTPLISGKQLQDRILQNGYLLWYIYFAIDGNDLPDSHPYKQQWYDPNQTDLSRNLLGILTAGHEWNAGIVKRAVPEPLWSALEQPLPKHRQVKGVPKKKDKEILELTLWSQIHSGKIRRLNWHPVFESMDRQQNAPALIWNKRSKAELLTAIEIEIQNYQVARTIRENCVWNYESFDVKYPSLKRYFKVGKFYVSRFIAALSNPNTKITMTTEAIALLAFELFQRAPVEDDPGWKLACIRALRLIYDRFPVALRGLQLIPYFTWLLSPHNFHPIIRDHVIHFLLLLLQFPENCKQFIHFGGVAHLRHWIAQIHTLTEEDAREHKSFLSVFLAGLAQIPSPETIQDKSDAQENKEKTASAASENDLKGKTPKSAKSPTSPTSPNSPNSGKEDAEEEEDDEEHDKEIEESKRLEKQQREEAKNTPQNLGGIQLSEDDKQVDDEDSDEYENLLKGLPAPLSEADVSERCLALLILVSRAGPRIKRTVSSPETIQTLTRLLLAPFNELRQVGVQLLLELLDDGLYMVPHLARTGIWTFLVYALRWGINPQLATLISRYHHKQAEEYTPKGTSILSPFFPSPLVRVLQVQGPETFIRLFERDTNHPELIWNEELRSSLHARVASRVTPFINRLRDDPVCEYVYDPATPIEYPELENELCIGYSYLRVLNELGVRADACNQLSTLEVTQPSMLLTELYEATASRSYTGSDLIMILQAQALLVKRYPALKEALSYNVEPLMELLVVDESVDPTYERLEKTAELLHHLLVLDSDTATNVFECRGLDRIVDALSKLLSLDNGDDSVRARIVPPVYHLLNAVSVMAGKQSGALKHMEHSPALVKQIVSLLAWEWAINYPNSTMASCKCLFTFTQLSEKFQQMILDTGALLNLIRLALFYTAPNEQSNNSQNQESEQDANASKPETDWTQKIQLGSAYVLSALQTHATGNERVQKIMETILSPSLFKLLSSPADFLARVHMVENSSITSIRDQIQMYLDAELANVRQAGGKWNGWQSENFKFQLSLPISEAQP